MWTARYGVLGSEEEETRPDIMSPKKDHLELEIHMNEIGHEDENNNKIDKKIRPCIMSLFCDNGIYISLPFQRRILFHFLLSTHCFQN